MSDSIKSARLLLKEFPVNKKFARCGTVCFTLDLHFYGDVHLTNWGHFNTYDSAVRFATDMMWISIIYSNTYQDDPCNPEERIEV